MPRTQRIGTFDAKTGVDYGYLEADGTWTGWQSPSAGVIDDYINGTKVGSMTSTGRIYLDNIQMKFGTGNDVQVDWDGTKLVANSALNPLWTDAPSELDPNYDSIAFKYFDDFFEAPVDANRKWLEADDGATGTNASADALGGVGNIVTAAADNDYHAISSLGENFNCATAKELWFEAAFTITEATTNESTWWFGLTDTLTTGGVQANAAGPLASYDGVLMWTIEGDLAILSETSNAGTQATNTTLGNYTSGTRCRVGFHIDGTATTAVVTFYSDLTNSGTMTAFGTTKTLTRAGLESMHVVAGVKAGPSAGAETLGVDYIKCVQLR